jgi:transposase
MAEAREELDELTNRANPALRAARGVGVDVAAILLTAAGDDPSRIRDEAAFASLCGVSPVEASSGKTSRHRLNRSGNRQANHALWRIVLVRRGTDPRTRAYVERRRSEGKSDREITRCLKRYVAREIFPLLVAPPDVRSGADLKAIRKQAAITAASLAEELGTHLNTIYRLERMPAADPVTAARYEKTLVTLAEANPHHPAPRAA